MVDDAKKLFLDPAKLREIIMSKDEDYWRKAPCISSIDRTDDSGGGAIYNTYALKLRDAKRKRTVDVTVETEEFWDMAGDYYYVNILQVAA